MIDFMLDLLILLCLVLLTGLVLMLAYHVGVELQWQHITAVNDCVAHNLNATDGSICLV